MNYRYKGMGDYSNQCRTMADPSGWIPGTPGPVSPIPFDWNSLSDAPGTGGDWTGASARQRALDTVHQAEQMRAAGVWSCPAGSPAGPTANAMFQVAPVTSDKPPLQGDIGSAGRAWLAAQGGPADVGQSVSSAPTTPAGSKIINSSGAAQPQSVTPAVSGFSLAVLPWWAWLGLGGVALFAFGGSSRG